MSKKFPTLDVVSAATGWHLSDNGFGAIVEVLDFLTGEGLFTHQLPAASEWAQPHIYEQFPWMMDVETILQNYTNNGDKEGLLEYSKELPLRYGSELVLSPIEDDYNPWLKGQAITSLCDIIDKRPHTA